jgi:hypothetical protein
MLGKGNPSCGFCGSMMSNSAHRRIINCPRVEAIGTFSKAPINLLNGTFACDDVSQEDGLRLLSKYTHEFPLYLRSLYPSIATSLLAFAHELLYQANNRAAEVTMYGKLEVYTKTTTE